MKARKAEESNEEAEKNAGFAAGERRYAEAAAAQAGAILEKMAA